MNRPGWLIISTHNILMVESKILSLWVFSRCLFWQQEHYHKEMLTDFQAFWLVPSRKVIISKSGNSIYSWKKSICLQYVPLFEHQSKGIHLQYRRRSIPESGRSPGGGNGNPLQYSCLENSLDRGAWWARVHRVKKESGTT